MMKFLFTIILYAFSISIFSQGLKVVEMKMSQTDFDVRKSEYARTDNAGERCALVKVRLNTPDVKFGKVVVGDVKNKTNEYWVYMPLGTKELQIKREHYLPFVINFSDYGIEKIESNNQTYIITLKETKFKTEKHTVLLNATPKYARLKVDGYEINNDNDGSYRLYLDKGEHICKLDANGFRPTVKVVNSGKGIENCDVMLESLMANVNIECAISDADIYINGEKRSVGSWKGELVAGNYTIEERKLGFKPYSQTVKVEEKGNYNWTMPVLNRTKGTIVMIPNANRPMRIWLDGHETKMESYQIQNVPSGKHKVKMYMYGYEPTEKDIVVNGIGNDTLRINFKIKLSCVEAVGGNPHAQYMLGGYYKRNEVNDVEEKIYWLRESIAGYTEKIETISFPNAPWDEAREKDELLENKINVMEDLARTYGSHDAQRGKYDLNKAKEIYLEILRLSDTFSDKRHQATPRYDACFAIGGLYKEEKKYNEAIEWYLKCEKCYDTGGNFKIYCLDLGDCYFNMGNKEQARYWYQRATSSTLDHIRDKALTKLESL